jgi:hypothetical protein
MVQKLTAAQIVNQFLAFNGLDSAFQCSQHHYSSPLSQSNESSGHPQMLYP